tara:strand:+ start:1460 stop:1849 length:390 start_codon:yes stop_codon:yes gene_type:complete
MEINYLVDLNRLRSAPKLSKNQRKRFSEELETNILNADWITIGIMASYDYEAIKALESISRKYSLIKFKEYDYLRAEGRVFLKGNQKTGNVYLRSENGLGEGILLTCQYEINSLESSTFGPLPLDFFSN